MTFCLAVLLISSCNGNSEEWNSTLDYCIASSDSTTYYFDNKLSIEELNTTLRSAYMLWSDAKSVVVQDTLDLEFAQELDAFNVAYHNSINLPTEYESCKRANATSRIRLQNLKTDIENGSGSRSDYCSNVQHEKEELTKIRNHCTDIQRRFEELKTRTSQFEQTLARYSGQ